MRFILQIVLAMTFVSVIGCQTFTNIPSPMTQQNTASSDQAITSAIKSAFFDSGAYHDATLDVITEGGVVTLSGYVKSIRQYDTAVKIASETPGVQGVRNHLVIRK